MAFADIEAGTQIQLRGAEEGGELVSSGSTSQLDAPKVSIEVPGYQKNHQSRYWVTFEWA